MVGAEPTKGVQRLIEKFDFTPRRHDPFGSPHKYKKPDQVMCYRNGSYRGEPFKLNANDRKVEWHYRQKLQEQMYLVERRRRLSKEVLSGSHVPIEASEQAVQPEEDTDAHDSEDPDIFSRKAKFEALQKKFQKHQKEKGLLLKGNDLRTNIYIKKMEKLARHDMGLDVIGYKDYVNNLKSFAKYHDDLAVFAVDNFEKMDEG